MKIKVFLFGVVASLGLSIPRASAGVEVSATVQIHATADFYEPLSTHGTWVEVGSYGRCWRPAHLAVEWRPYCYGSWVWTDCGWYWVSDEPWGWACYHYGSWVNEPAYGWIWVPGVEWAPAWVSWRVGGGYIGWAPLPPRGVVVARVEPPPFMFVELHRFHEPVRPATVVVNNTTIINKTTQINNIRQETKNFGPSGPQKVMVNEGPGLDVVQKATDKKIRVVSVQEAARQTPVPPTATGRMSEPKRPDAAVTPPEKPRQPPHSDVVPSPARPPAPAPGAPVPNTPHPPKRNGEGRDGNKGHEGHEKERN